MFAGRLFIFIGIAVILLAPLHFMDEDYLRAAIYPIVGVALILTGRRWLHQGRANASGT